MQKDEPQISIVIPTYNRAQLITETLRSFNEQSFKNWEAIVIDDGSSDNTAEVVENFQDSRIKLFQRGENHKKGPSGCRNFGLMMATGEYVLFFDDDDIAHPDLLQICIKEFQHNDVDFCRYLRTVFYNNLTVDFDRSKVYTSFEIDTGDLEKMITNKLPFNTCAVIWKRSCLSDERFNEELFYSDEWEFYQRLLSQKNIKGISLNKILLFARKHKASSTGNYQKQNPKYLNSTRKAMRLVIENLNSKNRITPGLRSFFIRQSFALKDRSILDEILQKTNTGLGNKIKYLMGFRFYSFLKPYFRFKKKLSH